MILNMTPIIMLILYYYTHFIEGSFSFIIPVGLSFFWITHSVLINGVKKVLFNRITIWWWAYLFLCAFMVIIGFSSTNLNFVISRLALFVIPGMGYFVIQNYNRKEQVLLLFFFSIIYGVNLLYNIALGFEIPGIFEEQESTELSIQYRVMMNIADTGFINVGVLILGALFMAILVSPKTVRKFCCLSLIIPIIYYMLFQNTRGTAILLLVVEIAGFLLAYFEPKRLRNRKSYYFFMGATLAILTVVLFVPIIELILSNLQSERLASRMNDLIDFRQSGGDADQLNRGSFSERLLLARTSLNSFLSSPLSILIGIGDHTQTFGGDLVKSGVGGHSEFIDVAARYGLVGIFVFVKILKYYYQLLKRLSKNREVWKYVSVVFFIIILTGIFNNVFNPKQLLFLYIVFPIIIILTDSKTNRING